MGGGDQPGLSRMFMAVPRGSFKMSRSGPMVTCDDDVEAVALLDMFAGSNSACWISS